MITEVTIQTKDNKEISISGEQLDNMKHAIGFRRDRVKGRKYRKFEAVRNYYNDDKNPSLDDLVEKGLMNCRELGEGWSGNRLYSVSEFGFEALSKILDVKITEQKD